MRLDTQPAAIVRHMGEYRTDWLRRALMSIDGHCRCFTITLHSHGCRVTRLAGDCTCTPAALRFGATA